MTDEIRTYDFCASSRAGDAAETDAELVASRTTTREESLDGWEAYEAWLRMMREDFPERRG